ncbi:MAG TPA: PD-(D/E)XK nuclease family protein [Flavobacteriaceae bacterium]|nr:PD-(D/E)XK nuclease family protein [Flavobacteriaceae bacterium]
MKTFLEQVVDDLLFQKHDFKSLTLVLPSQRASLFTKEIFKKNISRASYLPNIISIETFIQEVADIQIIDNTQLLFEFYNAYINSTNNKEQVNFSNFISWAPTAIQDFNEIDANLVNSDDLFKNLSDLQQLNNWFKTNEYSDITKNYIDLFKDLSTYYNQLSSKLKNLKFGYQGLIYREATANLEYFIQSNQKQKIVFIGFNALNKAEEYIIQELLENDVADIYWDYNKNLNTSQEGKFINNYKSTWKYYKTNEFKYFETDQKLQNIKIYGAPKNITQLKHVSTLIEKSINTKNTALVLADESLLPIALNSLPQKIENINITMGFPLEEIPLVAIFYKIFKVYTDGKDSVNKSIYFDDLLSLVKDPFLSQIEPKLFYKLTEALSNSNQVYYTANNINSNFSETEIKQLSWFFHLIDKNNSPNQLINYCIHLINQLKKQSKDLEIQYLFALQKVFNQLKLLNKKYNYITDVKTLSTLFKKLIKLEKIPFQGEPLSGLQLLGMLETRVLDFENVIITSVNEGILPVGKTNDSFIPFDIKKHYGLPTFTDKDAIYAYHFYRLIQRAKNVFLYYNTESDGFGSGEKSRFLTSILLNNPNVKHTIISPKVTSSEKEILQIKKTSKVLDKLKTLFAEGISASALATYIYNPISFYQQYVLGIKEEDEIEETVAANTMGSIIHEALDKLYKPYVGVLLTVEVCNKIKQNIEKELVKAFIKIYKNGDYTTGKNKLIFEVSKNYISRFISNELREIQAGNKIIIQSLEKRYLASISGLEFPVKIKGIIDRVDTYNGTLRIIDYKTGNVTASQLKIADFSVIPTDYKYTKALQVMLYAYLYTSANTFNFKNPLQAGIISFKNLKANFIKMNFAEKRNNTDNNITEDKLIAFLNEIKLLFNEICNPEIPFIENQDKPF